MAHHARRLCCPLWRLVFVRGLKKERAFFRRGDSCQVTCINVAILGRHHNGLSPHVPGSQYPPPPTYRSHRPPASCPRVHSSPWKRIAYQDWTKLSTLENWKTGRQEQRGFVRWRESRFARHTLRNVLRCTDLFWETGTCVWMHPNTSRSNEIQRGRLSPSTNSPKHERTARS